MNLLLWSALLFLELLSVTSTSLSPCDSSFMYSICSSSFYGRFDFLQSWHQYNTYYEFKKNYFMQKEGKVLPEVFRFMCFIYIYVCVCAFLCIRILYVHSLHLSWQLNMSVFITYLTRIFIDTGMCLIQLTGQLSHWHNM